MTAITGSWIGSQAHIGGGAGAPVVASAFHPSLAPVDVLLAVFGYAFGTSTAPGCAGNCCALQPADQVRNA